MTKTQLPSFNGIINRSEYERILKQRACVLWASGLPCAGKTTISRSLAKVLLAKGFFVQLLDGDEIRSGLNIDLDFSNAGRNENIRRVAEVAKLFLRTGIITICSFITPSPESRKIVKDIVGKDNLVEAYVNAPVEICEKRDVKGMYKKARQGLIENFTGVNAPFVAPESSDIILHTHKYSVDECVQQLLDCMLPKITQ